jgi:ribosomal protein L28
MMHRNNTTSKLSKLELAVAHIMDSVEATIRVEVINGDWPRGFRGIFTANTASMDDMKATLLAFGDGRLPMDGRSKVVKLSRRVVSVELRRPEMEKGKKPKLKISAQALRINKENDMWRHGLVFTPEQAGKSRGTLKVGSCEMEVTVAWSLLSTFKCSYDRRG